MTDTICTIPNRQVGSPVSPIHRPQPPNEQGFAGALKQANLKFSNHARKRLEKRQINMSDDGLARLATAIDKAKQRGGQESLVLMDNLAFIVNVRERTVVTALDTQRRGDGVFTSIDSVVLADRGA